MKEEEMSNKNELDPLIPGNRIECANCGAKLKASEINELGEFAYCPECFQEEYCRKSCSEKGHFEYCDGTELKCPYYDRGDD